jgi:hypothetical protein
MKSILALLPLLFLLGCTCQEVTVFEKVPVPYTQNVTYTQEYVFEQPVSTQECNTSFSVTITYEDPWWDGDVLRRTAHVTNNEEENGLFEITKVYLINGEEVDRDMPPREHVIDAHSTKTFYLTWYTQPDSQKNIALDILKTSDLSNPVCVTTQRYENKTGTKKITTQINKTRYETVIKKVCK